MLNPFKVCLILLSLKILTSILTTSQKERLRAKGNPTRSPKETSLDATSPET